MENWKIHECVEIKHTPEHQWVREEIKKNLETKMETQHTKTQGMQQK